MSMTPFTALQPARRFARWRVHVGKWGAGRDVRRMAHL